MNGRKNNFLIPVATVVLAASLIGLGVSVDQLFFSAQPKAAVHIAAGSAGGNASKVLSPTANVLDNPANNPQNNHQSTAINNQPNNRVNSRSAYSIFHPPPVVSEHLHGILNSKLSYPVRFIMAMAAAPGGQTIALATEGQGLVMFRPNARPPHRWVQFHPEKNGTGFPSWNTYSVCFDSQGRLWVGTLRKGVMVGFIGHRGWQWRHYDEICRPATARNPNLPNEGAMTFNGPIGCHVFAIAENPVDHSIWISTEAGISIYYPRGSRRRNADLRGVHTAADSASGNTAPTLFGRWRYITQANGLPSSPVDCMAFDKTGRIFAGTQCNGIAISNMQDNYQHWRIVPGPEHVTIHARGRGLPSDLINAILVTKQSKIYVATDWGLGISDDDGANWHYIRGQDYAAKVAQLWHPPKHWQQPDPQSLSQLLPGDHITCLAEDFKGRIWLGTWRNGYAIYQPGKGIVYHNTLAKGEWRHGGDYVNAILPVHLDETDSEGIGGPAKVVLVGQYGVIAHPKSSGVSIAWEGGQNPAKHVNERQPKTRFPAAAMPPTRDQLAEMLHNIQSTPLEPMKPGQVVALPADWRTEGNWEGNYGKYCMYLFAFWENQTLAWGPGPLGPWLNGVEGPHRPAGDVHDTVGFWPIWKSGRQSGNSLLIPYLYQKILTGMGKTDFGVSDHRQAEIDDEGEDSPTTWQGPGLCNALSVPAGYYVVAPYEINCIGHSGLNRQRDCRIEVHSHASWGPSAAARWKMDMYGKPVLARERVANFSNGVWQPFLVRGPATVVISIRRNYSYTTPESGLAMDYVNEHPAPYYFGLTAWKARLRGQAVQRAGKRQQWNIRTISTTPGEVAQHFVKEILGTEEFLMYSAPTTWGGNHEQIYMALLRWIASHGRPPGMLPDEARAEYRLALFGRWNRTEHGLGLETPAKIDAALRWNGINADYRGFDFSVIRREIERSDSGEGNLVQ